MLNFSIAVISNHVKKIRQYSRLLICFVPSQSLGSGKLLVVVIVTCPDSQSADRFIAVVSADIYSLFYKVHFFHGAS